MYCTIQVQYKERPVGQLVDQLANNVLCGRVITEPYSIALRMYNPVIEWPQPKHIPDCYEIPRSVALGRTAWGVAIAILSVSLLHLGTTATCIVLFGLTRKATGLFAELRPGRGAVSSLHLSLAIAASRLAPDRIPENAISKGHIFLPSFNLRGARLLGLTIASLMLKKSSYCVWLRC